MSQGCGASISYHAVIGRIFPTLGRLPTRPLERTWPLCEFFAVITEVLATAGDTSLEWPHEEDRLQPSFPTVLPGCIGTSRTQSPHLPPVPKNCDAVHMRNVAIRSGSAIYAHGFTDSGSAINVFLA